MNKITRRVPFIVPWGAADSGVSFEFSSLQQFYAIEFITRLQSHPEHISFYIYRHRSMYELGTDKSDALYRAICLIWFRAGYDPVIAGLLDTVQHLNFPWYSYDLAVSDFQRVTGNRWLARSFCGEIKDSASLTWS